MLTNNPFAELASSISPGIMTLFVILMIALVVGGTVFDVVHKKSAKYFFNTAQKAAENAVTPVKGPKRTSLAIKTIASDVLTSSEFCNQHRRIAHLLGMYGFVFFVISTLALVFGMNPADTSGGFWGFIWRISALMICVGGYWFWFFIRVDVSAEGNSPFRIVRADMFVLSLLGMATFGLLWSFSQGTAIGWIFFGLFLLSTVLLFGGVPWSKFAHMFFKPAAAFQKKVAMANGSAMNLPTISRDDPEQQKRHSMSLLVDAPMDMGLGIKREAPRHH